MQNRVKTRLFALMAVGALAGAAACDSPVDPHADDDLELQLVDRSTGELLAASHDDHWDGILPAVLVGQEVAFDALFLQADGGQIQLGGEYTVRARLAANAPAGIVEIDNHGDHVDITGLAAGETQLVFMLWHGSHSDWDSPAITITVQEP